jgi:hypothetical protein
VGPDPTELHVLVAYGWLLVAGAMLVANGTGDLGLTAIAAPVDAERHILGAGYATTLILGVGARLLAGFANRPVREARLIWATLALSGLAALLRVVPRLFGIGGAEAVLALAGLAGMLAVGVFWWNLPATAPDR